MWPPRDDQAFGDQHTQAGTDGLPGDPELLGDLLFGALAVSAAGGSALLGAMTLALALIGALCWVLASPGRTARLVKLIRALRQR